MLLNEIGKRATFFCVGKMATEFPDVIKKIANQGHEIGCHSNFHAWLNKMTKEEARQDTREAVDSLEQKVIGHLLFQSERTINGCLKFLLNVA